MPSGAAPLLGLLLSCRPTAPVEPSPSAPTTATATTEPHDAATGSRAEGEAADLPDTCELQLELLEPTGASGHGKSSTSGKEAKDAAWAEACASLQKSHGLDCNDATTIGVTAETSQSLQVRQGGGQHEQRFEHRVTLAVRRRATGFGDAPGDREEACRRAKAHACQELVKGPCPADGLRVISVDGHPPRPASVEPRPSTAPPRPTI